MENSIEEFNDFYLEETRGMFDAIAEALGRETARNFQMEIDSLERQSWNDFYNV